MPYIIKKTIASATICLGVCYAASGIAAEPEESATVPSEALPAHVPLPAPYETVIVSLGALSSSAATEQKTARNDSRVAALRRALTEHLLNKNLGNSLALDADDKTAELATKTLLCDVRKDYVSANMDVNYLSSLVAQLTEISKPAAKPGDLFSAIKLMLANSSFEISDKAKNQPKAKIEKQISITCDGDLKQFDAAYYGVTIKFGQEEVAAESAEEALIPLTFLGPIGTLASAIVSILEPIFIDASTFVDEQKREAAVKKALDDNKSKIESYSKELSNNIDNYANLRRRQLAGQFNEVLTALRSQEIDLSKEDSCRKMLEAKRLPDGEPSSQFVKCWRTAWNQIQPQVTSLAKIGDDYDALADVATQNTSDQLNTILKSYQQISSGNYTATNVFWDAVTQFIGLANAIKSAASASNIQTFEKDVKAVTK